MEKVGSAALDERVLGARPIVTTPIVMSVVKVPAAAPPLTV